MTIYLPTAKVDELSDEVYNNVGYTLNLRNIFLSEIMRDYVNAFARDGNEKVQLDLDLQKLNRTEQLTDGTIPLYSWLQRVERYGRPYPSLDRLIKMAMATIEGKRVKSAPVVNVQAPSQPVLRKIEKERVVQRNDMLSYGWLDAGMKAGISVARLRISRYDNGQLLKNVEGAPVVYSGTGWLLTPQLMITNYHVVEARDDNEPNALAADVQLQVAAALAEFDYNADNVQGKVIKITGLEAADPQLDYAILRLAELAANRVAPARLPNKILVADNGGGPQAVNIIQHPFGYSKKVAIRNNHIFEATYPMVRYFTDTEKGSSGSPVFNDQWQVIALHRASQLVENVQYQGLPTGWVNEGVQLKAIFDHLQGNYASLVGEIGGG